MPFPSLKSVRRLCSLFAFTAVTLDCLATGNLTNGALPTVKLFTTGGTIQSKGAHRGKLSEYNEGRVKPQELIDDLPELKEIVKIEVQEISNIGSGGINTDLLLKLAKAINAELAKPDITGA